MNYWCHTCNCYKGARGADECAVDSHSIVPAKDRELKIQSAHEARLEIIQKLGYGPSSISSPEWIVGKVEAEREAFKKEIASLKKSLEKALGVSFPDEKPFTREDFELLRNSPFKGISTKEEWIPMVGDRVYVSGKTWSGPGTIVGFSKDEPEVPWIKVDKDGATWDARDFGSIRKLEQETS